MHILKTLKHYQEALHPFIKSNGVYLSLLLSMFALFFSAYNTVLITRGDTQLAGSAVANFEDPEKLSKDIPANAPFLGNPDAKLTMVEFGDFQCQYCGRFFIDTLPELKERYIDTGKIKFVYLDYAFMGQESISAAVAAKCAQEQNSFWQYHDRLYVSKTTDSQESFSDDNLKRYASETGLNRTQFDECLDSKKYVDAVSEELQLGKRYGVSGTPSFFIGSQNIKGAAPLDTFIQAIEENL